MKNLATLFGGEVECTLSGLGNRSFAETVGSKCFFHIMTFLMKNVVSLFDSKVFTTRTCFGRSAENSVHVYYKNILIETDEK
jgi:hypothetical protein